jgi:hypothetical protein
VGVLVKVVILVYIVHPIKYVKLGNVPKIIIYVKEIRIAWRGKDVYMGIAGRY